MRNSARIESERVVNEASKDADNTVATAKAQSKQMLDEATTRATAIHDGAERRLNLLTSRHTETMRRLTEIRDVVTNLVSSETARGSLEEEVAKSVATAQGTQPAAAPAAPAGRAAATEARHAPAAQQMPGRGGARESGATRPAAQSEQRSAPAAAQPTAQPGQHAAGTEGRSPATAKAPRPAPAQPEANRPRPE
jgi:vacuolar-type H+-ATPase subunit H